MAGGGGEEVNRGLEKKKVSGCRFFPFRHPLVLVTDANQRLSAQIALEHMREAISHIILETSLAPIPGPLYLPDALKQKLDAVNSFALEYMSKSGN
jgi:hypothetical protein